MLAVVAVVAVMAHGFSWLLWLRDSTDGQVPLLDFFRYPRVIVNVLSTVVERGQWSWVKGGDYTRGATLVAVWLGEFLLMAASALRVAAGLLKDKAAVADARDSKDIVSSR